MVDIRHLEDGQIVTSQRKKSPAFDEIWYTTADLELSDSHVTKYENF